MSGCLDNSDDLEKIEKKPVENAQSSNKTSVNVVLTRYTSVTQEGSSSKDKFQSPTATTSSWTETKHQNTEKEEGNAPESELTNSVSVKGAFKRKMSEQAVAPAAFVSVDKDHLDTDDGGPAIEIKRIKSEHEVLISVVESLQSHKEQDESDDSVFSRYVSNEMSYITDFRAKQIAKFKILNLIFDAQFVNTTDYSSMSTPLMSPRPVTKGSSKQLPILHDTRAAFHKEKASDVSVFLFSGSKDTDVGKNDDDNSCISSTATIIPSSKKGVNYKLSKQPKESSLDDKSDKVNEDSKHDDKEDEKSLQSATVVLDPNEGNSDSLKKSNENKPDSSKASGSDKDLTTKKKIKECRFDFDVSEIKASESISSTNASPAQPRSKAETSEVTTAERVPKKEKATTTDEVNEPENEIIKNKEDAPKHS